MGTIIGRNRPCRECPSSDAAQEYSSGWTHCFSCGANYKTDPDEQPTEKKTVAKNNKINLEEIADYPVRGNKSRLITKPVMEAAKVRCSYDEQGAVEAYYFPEVVDGKVVGYKRKSTKDKTDQYVIGTFGGMFNLDPWRNGGKRIVITEGEEDCLAVGQAFLSYYGQLYPHASMGGVDQTKYLLKERDTLRKFDEIIIWFDNDTQGKEATEKACRILGYDKVRVVSSDVKDACDKLRQTGNSKEEILKFLRLVWDAKATSPASIVRGEDTWEKYKEFKDIEYVPWPPFLSRLNELTYGRALGSITMIAAGTSIGKSTLLREDLYHLLQTTDDKIGACFLEESIGETVAGILSLDLNKRITLPDVETTEEEEKGAWDRTLGLGRTLFVDHQGSISDGSLLDKLEYLALSGCRYIYLDHITIAVSESEERDTNKAIDIFMSSLLKLVKRYNIWVGVVSHLRKVKQGEDSFESGGQIFEDDLKGSGSLKQISFQTIAISRNKLAEDVNQRNQSQLWLLKDRKTGNTGPAGAYRFNGGTGRLEFVNQEKDQFEIDDEVEIIE